VVPAPHTALRYASYSFDVVITDDLRAIDATEYRSSLAKAA